MNGDTLEELKAAGRGAGNGGLLVTFLLDEGNASTPIIAPQVRPPAALVAHHDGAAAGRPLASAGIALVNVEGRRGGTC